MKTVSLLFVALLCASCGSLPLPGGGTVTGTPGWYKSSSQLDPAARFGVLVEAHAGVVVPEK